MKTTNLTILVSAFLVVALRPVLAEDARASRAAAKKAELLCRALWKPSAQQLVSLSGRRAVPDADRPSVEANVAVPGYRHFVVSATRRATDVELRIWWKAEADTCDFTLLACSLRAGSCKVEIGKISGAEDGDAGDFPANRERWHSILQTKLLADALVALGYDPETGKKKALPGATLANR